MQTPLGRWRRRRRREKAFKQQLELREFVYLDDVSVFSLIGSLLGPVATEFTSSEAASLQAEVSGSVGVNFGVKKGDVGSRLTSENTSSTQVVRRSIVQTTFKELRDEAAKAGLVLDSSKHSTIDAKLSNSLPQDPGADSVDLTELRRGRLIEVDVELEADPIFKVSAAVSAVIEMIQETPQMFDIEAMSGLADARAVQKIIQRLLTGLVPIRGRVLDYVVIDEGGTRRVVRSGLVDALEPGPDRTVQPLYLVGVVSETLFWKDVRQVLFSRSRYRALCRLSHDGIGDRWTASKLVDVLSSAFPALGDQLNDAVGAALLAMETSGTDAVVNSDEMALDALTAFGLALASSQQQSIDPIELRELVDLTVHERDLEDLVARRAAFSEVASLLSSKLGFATDVSREGLARMRTQAMREAGLDPTAAVGPRRPTRVGVVADGPRCFLEAEFVAIYW